MRHHNSSPIFFVAWLAYVGVAYAGVGVLTPEIEREALELWRRFCGSGQSEGKSSQSTFIFCKRSDEVYEENLQHSIDLPSNAPSEQVIFVQPPSYNYRHNVVVTGGGGQGPKTVIYVKPAKNTNEVNVIDQTQPNAPPQKPTLYFLKGSHGGERQVDSQPRPPPPPQPHPQPEQPGGYNYEVPSKSFNY